MRIFDKLVVVGLVTAISLAASTAPAQKGGGGGGGSTAPSTIFYDAWVQNQFTDTFRMSGDGSGKTILFPGAVMEGTHPSYGTRGDRRWFVQWGWNGSTYGILFRSDLGLVKFFEVDASNLRLLPYSFRWVPGDNQVSFIATRFQGDQAIDAGFYVLEVAWGGNEPAGISQPSRRFAIPLRGSEPSLEYYDWNPQGTAVVATTRYDGSVTTGQLVVVSTAGIQVLRTSNTYPSYPAWAPGSKNQIAFSEHNGRDGLLYTINVTGSGLKQIAKVSRSAPTDAAILFPCWSPDGNHIAYVEWGTRFSTFEQWYYLNRIPSGGGTKTKLADGLPLGWR
jgi:hypothetical protein